MRNPTLAMLAGLILGFPKDILITAQTGTVQGTVRETGIGGGALTGAIVTVDGTALRTLTDRNGRYTVTAVPAGPVRVRVAYGGFVPAAREIAVRAGQTVTADFILTLVGSPGPEAKDERAVGAMPTQEALHKVNVASGQPSSIMYRSAQFNTEEYGHRDDNQWQSPRRQPLSTFLIDVDATSYGNVRRFRREGTLPPRDAVRVEEMIHYFHSDYPNPRGDHLLSVTAELGRAPWNPAHRFALIGLQD